MLDATDELGHYLLAIKAFPEPLTSTTSSSSSSALSLTNAHGKGKEEDGEDKEKDKAWGWVNEFLSARMVTNKPLPTLSDSTLSYPTLSYPIYRTLTN